MGCIFGTAVPKREGGFGNVNGGVNVGCGVCASGSVSVAGAAGGGGGTTGGAG